VANRTGYNLLHRTNDYRSVFNTEAGQKVLIDLCQICGMFDSSYVRDYDNAVVFNEGQRNVALHILKILRYTPEEIITLSQQKLVGDQHGQSHEQDDTFDFS
jgi:hypothetical protein